MVVEKKAVIVVPAFNEESVLRQTLRIIRETNVPAHIVVVNDGSTDRTEEIARVLNCEVVNLPKNRGKANAVFAGFRAALKHSPTAVVTLDADLVRITSPVLRSLVNIAHHATTRGKVLMSVFPYAEEGVMMGTYSSGVRSFSVQALHKLQHSGLRKIPKGYGLEAFLNKFFEKSVIELPKFPRADFVVHQRIAFRKKEGRNRQQDEIFLTRERMRKAIESVRRKKRKKLGIPIVKPRLK
ncbi:MAG: glycosyltransferase [Candidatus Diapherotrites archaeon]|nr:glycosyltransferase [Candidatus Diapherotrites archaeon]